MRLSLEPEKSYDAHSTQRAHALEPSSAIRPDIQVDMVGGSSVGSFPAANPNTRWSHHLLARRRHSAATRSRCRRPGGAMSSKVSGWIPPLLPPGIYTLRFIEWETRKHLGRSPKVVMRFSICDP